jgi:hypothetical protein
LKPKEKEAHWTLDVLTPAAREREITVGRSQLRRIHPLCEGVRWCNPRPWRESTDPESSPQEDKGRLALHEAARGRDDHLRGRVGAGEPLHLSSCAGPWSSDEHRISRRPWNTAVDQRRSGSTVLCGCETARLSRSPPPRAIPKASCGCRSEPGRRPLPDHRQPFES